MQSVEKKIVVNAPIAEAFEAWSNIESWPKFLTAIREIRRIDDRQFEMKLERGGREYEAVAEISLLIPERRMAWRNVSGVQNSGVACFEALDDSETQVSLKMLYQPDNGWHDPDALAERLEFHLSCFKEFIEGQL